MKTCTVQNNLKTMRRQALINHISCEQLAKRMITFAVVFIPWVDAVLNTIAHQGVVNTHVAVAEERIG